MSTMRGDETGLHEEPAAPIRVRPWRRSVVMASLGAILGLGLVWALIGRPAPVAPPAASRSGNLLVNGSFEQPVGNLLTVGLPGSRWQRFRLWWSHNTEWNRIRLRRRERPVLLPLPPPPPELTGWRALKGTVDMVGRSYWQPAPGQGNQSIDLIGSPGAATIEQTFPTEPGRDYVFSGWLSHNPVIAPTLTRRANVYVNDTLLAQLSHGDPKTSTKNMRWKRFSYRVRATSSHTTLRISDVTAASATSPANLSALQLCGTALDGLSVTPATGD